MDHGIPKGYVEVRLTDSTSFEATADAMKAFDPGDKTPMIFTPVNGRCFVRSGKVLTDAQRAGLVAEILVPPLGTYYEWQPGMRSMTGKLGERVPQYEEATRRGFFTVLNFMAEVPGPAPAIMRDENDVERRNEVAAKLADLANDAIVHMGKGSASGSMIGTILKHAIFVKTYGWTEYVRQMKVTGIDGDDVKPA